MKRALIVSDDLRALIRHLPPALKGKIKRALEEIVTEPATGKALRDELMGLQSYRIGNTRIVYHSEEKSVTLITMGPRKSVYQKAALELKRQAEKKET